MRHMAVICLALLAVAGCTASATPVEGGLATAATVTGRPVSLDETPTLATTHPAPIAEPRISLRHSYYPEIGGCLGVPEDWGEPASEPSTEQFPGGRLLFQPEHRVIRIAVLPLALERDGLVDAFLSGAESAFREFMDVVTSDRQSVPVGGGSVHYTHASGSMTEQGQHVEVEALTVALPTQPGEALGLWLIGWDTPVDIGLVLEVLSTYGTEAECANSPLATLTAGTYESRLGGCIQVPTSWIRTRLLGSSVSYLYPSGRVYLDYKADWGVTTEEEADRAANWVLAGVSLVMQASGISVSCSDFEQDAFRFPNGMGFEYLLDCTAERDGNTSKAPVYIGLAPRAGGGALVALAVDFAESQFPENARGATRQVLSSYIPGDSCPTR